MALNSTATDVLTELYAGTDFSALSWLEQSWVAWYVWIGNPIIATGLMSFLLHEVCYLPSPFTSPQASPFFERELDADVLYIA